LSALIKKLGDVAEFIRGITFKPEDVVGADEPDAVVCMRTKNIQQQLEVDDVIAVPDTFVRRDELFLREGDILISSANSWNLVGKVAQVPALPYRATAGGFIAIVRARPGEIDSEYLYRWLASEPTQVAIRACGRQTTNISNLSVPRFLDLPIMVPERHDQVRVATILDKADSLRRKRQEAIRLADEFLRAVFIDMFGDPASNPRGFGKGTIRDLVASANYGTSEKASEHAGQYPILRMNNITYEGRWDFTALKYVDLESATAHKYLAQKGDLLFNRTNSKELVGKAAVYMRDESMAIAGYLVRVRMNAKGNPHYVAGYLNSAHGKQALVSRAKSIVGMANINAQEMQDIPLLLPPIELQNKYSRIVEALQEHLERSHAFLDKAESLHSALANQFFCRARNEAPETC
jgi:type I restriction enzyme, S subunit